MASKSAQQENEPEKAAVIEESLDLVDQTLDRVKSLYEQYFLGMQKQPPTFIHTDVERKLRDLAQLQIRNTALRYRFATLQQKFGAYNAYWRRTLRQIENGTYLRNLSKIGREAIRTGADIPEEILAAMPKRMREQVRRDRDAALLLRKRRERGEDLSEDEASALAEAESGQAKRKKAPGSVHVLDDSEDVDLSDLLGDLEEPDEVTESRSIPQPPSRASAAELQAAAALAAAERAAEEEIARFAQTGIPTSTRTPAAGVRQATNPNQSGAMPALRPGQPTPPTGVPPTGTPPSFAPANRAGVRTPPVGVEPPRRSSDFYTADDGDPMRRSSDFHAAEDGDPRRSPHSDPGMRRSSPGMPAQGDPALRRSSPGMPAQDGEPAMRRSSPGMAAQQDDSVMRRSSPAMQEGDAPMRRSSPGLAQEAPQRRSAPVVDDPPQRRSSPGMAAGGAGPETHRSAPAAEVTDGPATHRDVPPPRRTAPMGAVGTGGRTAIGPDTARRIGAPDAGPDTVDAGPKTVETGARIPSSRVTPPMGSRVPVPPGTNPGVPMPARPPRPAATADDSGARAPQVPMPARPLPRAATPLGDDGGARTPRPELTPLRPPAEPQARPTPVPTAGAAADSRPTVIPPSLGRTTPIPAMPSVPAPPRSPSGAMPQIPKPPLRAAPPVSSPVAAAAPPPASASADSEAEIVVPDASPGQRTPAIDRRPARLAKRDSQPAMQRPKPPPGMSDADVNALYAKYVKAKEMVGQNAGPGAYGRLLETINKQAPKIMEDYKSKGVEFQVVVRDNQVIIKAKPKP